MSLSEAQKPLNPYCIIDPVSGGLVFSPLFFYDDIVFTHKNVITNNCKSFMTCWTDDTLFILSFCTIAPSPIDFCLANKDVSLNELNSILVEYIVLHDKQGHKEQKKTKCL